jgi:rare lipoprotein A
VTNTRNGKSVVVRINDRGPFVRNRIIDLSKAAFRSIASPRAGVIPVRLERLD